nr:helix-turn-helix transcriptional regulator [Lachnospiraceae bacterium]
MKFDELFEQRSLVASKLKDCMCGKGYTKVSFAKKAGISRPTLDKLLNGSIDSKTTFDKHLQKILKMMNMSVDELMSYSVRQSKPVEAVYSQNAPCDYEMSDTAR